jgi:hypothetical protein
MQRATCCGALSFDKLVCACRRQSRYCPVQRCPFLAYKWNVFSRNVANGKWRGCVGTLVVVARLWHRPGADGGRQWTLATHSRCIKYTDFHQSKVRINMKLRAFACFVCYFILGHQSFSRINSFSPAVFGEECVVGIRRIGTGEKSWVEVYAVFMLFLPIYST